MKNKSQIYIGTSGWSNSYWRGPLYPAKARPADFLSLYAHTFNATEINSTFYRLPRLSTVEKWISSVPPEFKFCVKISRYITHMKKLNDAGEALAKFMDVLQPAKKMMGPLLIQLPPSLKFDRVKAILFFDLLKDYPGYTFALEARHETWTAKESIDLLTAYGITWVIAESGGKYPYEEHVTAPNVYLRFHGPEKMFDSSYTEKAMQQYARKIKKWQLAGCQVWVFFNNTMHEHALNNSAQLRGLLHKKPIGKANKKQVAARK